MLTLPPETNKGNHPAVAHQPILTINAAGLPHVLILSAVQQLAKKHPDCLEYIVVHEMTHHLERNHGPRFTKLMDRFMPNWRSLRDQLNEAPLAQEQWT